ncbi:NADH dehydrogenase [ubiquinone] 1 beta subcomplex subunit [Lachnellula suecica]|uniref:NADH dehydrogenase [ubiquinone] 1 beta subcomplex subunit n=1 Tax=Lachnellula suecica TaxID=602035 RepID=A0A8T9CJ48_9HELO|nr:NADH dehydrogenase [ubiquinone] 1 beta subcomplex subunit [Lachnellula suecica]
MAGTSMRGKPMPGQHSVQIPRARPLYRFAATGLSASMWFFLMYRAKQDGAVLLGWKHPWDH